MLSTIAFVLSEVTGAENLINTDTPKHIQAWQKEPDVDIAGSNARAVLGSSAATDSHSKIDAADILQHNVAGDSQDEKVSIYAHSRDPTPLSPKVVLGSIDLKRASSLQLTGVDNLKDGIPARGGSVVPAVISRLPIGYHLAPYIHTYRSNASVAPAMASLSLAMGGSRDIDDHQMGINIDEDEAFDTVKLHSPSYGSNFKSAADLAAEEASSKVVALSAMTRSIESSLRFQYEMSISPSTEAEVSPSAPTFSPTAISAAVALPIAAIGGVTYWLYRRKAPSRDDSTDVDPVDHRIDTDFDEDSLGDTTEDPFEFKFEVGNDAAMWAHQADFSAF